MRIIFQKSFEKSYLRLPEKTKKKIKERNVIFVQDPFDPRLNNHALTGKYGGCRSFNVTGDIRVIYKLIDIDKALFVEVGTHHKLYGT